MDNSQNVLRGFVEPNQSTDPTTDSSQDYLKYHRLRSRFSDDVAILFVVIALLIVVASGAFVICGLWRSKRQHIRLRKIVEMDSNDFLLYAQIAQQELSSSPCKTSLPCQMPYVGGTRPGVSSYPIIIPGYVRIVQVTHPAAKTQNYRKGKYRSVVVEQPKTKDVEIYLQSGQSLPKSTSSAPAILSGLWKQRHLLTGNKDTLVDSFTSLKKPIRTETVRTSHSDTSPAIDRSGDQPRQSTEVDVCQQCGSWLSLLAETFPRNISCRLCRERAGIRDVGMAADMTIKRSVHEPNSVISTSTGSLQTTTGGMDTAVCSVTPASSPKSPGRPKLSTFPDRRRKSCTPEVQAQLDPFRTMVLDSSSSEDQSSDSD